MNAHDFWKEKVLKVPRSQYITWVKEIHGDHIDEIQWLFDVEFDTGFPFISYMDDTHICRLDLSDPPPWVILRVWYYLEENEESDLKKLISIVEKKEITDDGREFHPTSIHSCRSVDTKTITDIFKKYTT